MCRRNNPPTYSISELSTEKSHLLWFYICGFNITIIAGLFSFVLLRLLGRPRRFLAAVLSVAGIAFYTLLVGAGPSVVRAAILGCLAIFARQLGRRQDGLNSLVFAAALLALLNANVLWDVGFQLTFMATLGLVLYADPLAQAFTRFSSRHLPPENVQRLAGPAGV